jgi:hypothetical protein
MDPRDAREESADCMMCLVVTGWSDSMLRDMVSRYKKVFQLFFLCCFLFSTVLGIRIRIRMFLDLPDPDPPLFS